MKIFIWVVVIILVIWGIWALAKGGNNDNMTANVNDAAMQEETADTTSDAAMEGATDGGAMTEDATDQGDAMTQ